MPLNKIEDLAHFADFILFSDEIQGAILQGKYNEAQSLVDKGLLEEINKGENDSVIRRRLMLFLAEIYKAQGKMLDAEKHV